MKMLSIEGLTKTYGEKVLFDNLAFHIGENERIGLIGVNGTGKSSLLKLIAGIDEPDSGELVHPNDYTIGYLPQEPDLSPDLTVLEQVYKSDSAVMKLLRSYEEAVLRLERDPGNAGCQEALFQLQKEMDAAGAWETSADAETILTKLGITDFTKKIAKLSGGQKKRVALAQVLIETPDLLILDEPTNHLDYSSVKWLEEFISKYRNSVLLVTHDRYFLDRVTNRIFELDHGKLYSYKGNYQHFIEAKALREEEMQQQEEKRKNLYRRELAWMRRGAKARSTKQKARIQRFEELEGNIGNLAGKDAADMALESSRLGKQVFELKHACKAFAGEPILADFNLLVKPQDRIGIVGKNGSGKTTLMNILAQEASLDSGELITGQTVRIAYYRQETAEMDENKRMIEYIRESGDTVTTKDGETISAAQMLERFLFDMHMHGTPIRKLSGGEKRRLYLLKLLMERPNVLLLDEPTNDLDTQTLTVLEDYIEEFPGVVISVSHDRYFLDKTAGQLLVFNGSGSIDRYYGTYSDYLENAGLEEKTGTKRKTAPAAPPAKESKRKKLTYNEQREWEEIEGKMAACEAKIAALNDELNEAGADFIKAQEIMTALDEENEKLEHYIERWSYLSEQQEL
ncbi:ABC-F family ATP-binding cassette domain-containing protein [Heyndrickxia acidiproducens]|uniref:ABC-F family ATP-binding cassette domain-containing protein n=1 Tax=Heyndrickxia acidiproducens TaxID=1121084 RepID=UPI0003686105|nr:ABC-F family ATP-binding cassette domain-containing protein [Heyndrickxia acidiproducens]